MNRHLAYAIHVMSFLLALMLLVPAIIGSPAYASCVADKDWPDRPCLDTPPYTQEEIQEAWAPYYDYKGSAWMEMKKAEMEQAARDGTLREWREYRIESSNFANENVYQYYKAFGQQPTPINDPGFRDDVIVTYWYISPIAIVAMAAIAGAGAISAFVIVRKSRRAPVK